MSVLFTHKIWERPSTKCHKVTMLLFTVFRIWSQKQDWVNNCSSLSISQRLGWQPVIVLWSDSSKNVFVLELTMQWEKPVGDLWVEKAWSTMTWRTTAKEEAGEPSVGHQVLRHCTLLYKVYAALEIAGERWRRVISATADVVSKVSIRLQPKSADLWVAARPHSKV